MLDATSLLGNLMKSAKLPAGQRLEQTLGAKAGDSGFMQQFGGGGGMLGELMGMLQGSAARASEGVRSNNPVAVGGLGTIAGALLGGRSGALGGGALALLGSLAMSALRNQGSPGATPAAADELPPEVRGPRGPQEAELVNQRAMLMLRAMIAAAKADDRIDRDEMDRIIEAIERDGADPEAKDFVLRQIAEPASVEDLARAAGGPREKAEVYAASLMAIDVDTPAERAYLDRLERALGLSPQVTAELRRSLGAGRD